MLERAIQSMFKSHKRISNETHFRDGTTSVAYKSLKVISDTYDKALVKTKKILFVGAGDIVKQLFKYNSKFNFNNIYISNRTKERAIDLANKHQSKVYDWDRVLANDFHDFDVIISAASNSQHLIKNIPITPHKVLLIDLGIPSNINKTIANNKNIIFYDLDSISADLEFNKEKRFAAIGRVNEIITEELSVYIEWLQEAPLRAFLAEYKTLVNIKVKNYFETDTEDDKIKMITNQIMRKLMAQPERLMSSSEINATIIEQASLLKKIVN